MDFQDKTNRILEKFTADNFRTHRDEWNNMLRSAVNLSPENRGVLPILQNTDSPGVLKRELAKLIDHTILKPDATEEQVVQICAEARKYEFASVCVNPSYVDICKRELSGSDVLVTTVVGFPLGANESRVKAFETERAIYDGADELDMVLPIGYLKNGVFHYVLEDIQTVVKAADGKTVKVILENFLLSNEEIVNACLIARDAGAHFVKTSTGFNASGADAVDVALMRKAIGLQMGVKAAGGVKNLDQAVQMIHAGASRIGASSSVQIVT